MKRSNTIAKIEKPRKKRKRVHSKKRTSKNKLSKNYVKAYRGQGK